MSQEATIPTKKTFDVNELDFTQETKKQLLHGREEHMNEIAIHSNPILPDDIDEYGNLPLLRCGWSACGKTFDSREQLMQHIKECIPNVFVDRLHVNCRNVLSNDADLTFAEFKKHVLDCYDHKTQQYIHDNELSAYYHKFQPLFKQHQFIKGDTKLSAAQKETVEILFNFRNEAQKEVIKEREHHLGLPDSGDSYGNLPKLRCAWSQCAKVFDTRDDLIKHVKECIPFTFVDRFHVNCKNILDGNPDLTLSEFQQRVKNCYDDETKKNIDDQELIDYYNRYQPSFKKHQCIKMPTAQKESAEILFRMRIKSQKKLIDDNDVPQQFPN